ncbi:hypothetical protein [Paracoccus aminophilus]|uniref:Uncharacterized protein n=1 Tax=Paracoccus aminophilus JCM 7686 TaxID=1367847 RepID=S5XWN4_PARAH|nr:hypothetical protein [Paracoccus aminophilus]AGT09707.1 hypothetical protein JCM7686_2651 [Paracoccus aminophilus JCM 7686]
MHIPTVLSSADTTRDAVAPVGNLVIRFSNGDYAEYEGISRKAFTAIFDAVASDQGTGPQSWGLFIIGLCRCLIDIRQVASIDFVELADDGDDDDLPVEAMVELAVAALTNTWDSKGTRIKEALNILNGCGASA